MWSRQQARFSWGSYDRQEFSKQLQPKITPAYNEKIYQIAKENSIDSIVELFDFLVKIDVIKLEGRDPLFEN